MYGYELLGPATAPSGEFTHYPLPASQPLIPGSATSCTVLWAQRFMTSLSEPTRVPVRDEGHVRVMPCGCCRPPPHFDQAHQPAPYFQAASQRPPRNAVVAFAQINAHFYWSLIVDHSSHSTQLKDGAALGGLDNHPHSWTLSGTHAGCDEAGRITRMWRITSFLRVSLQERSSAFRSFGVTLPRLAFEHSSREARKLGDTEYPEIPRLSSRRSCVSRATKDCTLAWLSRTPLLLLTLLHRSAPNDSRRSSALFTDGLALFRRFWFVVQGTVKSSMARPEPPATKVTATPLTLASHQHLDLTRDCRNLSCRRYLPASREPAGYRGNVAKWQSGRMTMPLSGRALRTTRDYVWVLRIDDAGYASALAARVKSDERAEHSVSHSVLRQVETID
ncbi:hypothetical protein FH972_026313 [Carpinus fangiana]|uniref:Uncharacterized protein n=1 Tax=Carpinus fangiana TaxID=176857 RepID=A0A5N6L3L5_9ROSI|nr:hypothetical protein FH972_026313 [Carpinus fangiana]